MSNRFEEKLNRAALVPFLLEDKIQEVSALTPFRIDMSKCGSQPWWCTPSTLETQHGAR